MTDFSNLYKQGYGEAAILNIGGDAVKIYAQQIAQQDQLRQKEREKWAKELEAIGDFKGARPQDQEYLLDKWNKILETNHAREMSTDKNERLKLASQMQLQKKQLMAEGNRSVQEYAMDKQLLTLPLQKDPDELNPNYGELIAARNKTSTFNPAFNNYSVENFALAPKVWDINKDILDAANIAATEVSEPITIGSGLDTRRAYREGKVLNEDKFRELILNRIQTNPSARRAYLRGAEPTEENLSIATEAALEAVRGKFAVKTRESNFVDPSGREMSLYKQKAAISDSYKDDDSSAPTKPVSITIPFADGASFTSSEYIPISIPKKNFAGSEFIDMKTGKPSAGKLASSNDYEIVGVTNAPIIKKGSRAQDGLEGAIAQPNFEKNNPDLIEYKPMIHVQLPTGTGNLKRDYLIPYDRMPENVKNSKAIKEALSNFRPAEGKTNQTQSSAPATSTPAPVIRNVISPSGQKIQIELRNGVWYNTRTKKKL